jgi:hypothetical protein
MPGLEKGPAMAGKSVGLQTILGANGTIGAPWLLKLLGLFMPIMREMPEMMYQYDRDYVFDSGKFTSRFGVRATPYAQGVKATVSKIPNAV